MPKVNFSIVFWISFLFLIRTIYTTYMKNVSKQRPIDPTKNAQDIFGDTSGLTGITTSSPEEGSAEPTENIPDSSHLPGTLVNEPRANPQYGIPRESVSDKVYVQNIRQGESQEEGEKSDDTASEDTSQVYSPPQPDYEETLSIDDITQEEQHDDKYLKPQIPSIQGEQSISGDMPEPDADADMEENAQAVGTQMDEDPEHPEEIDIGRDIDKAEEEILES